MIMIILIFNNDDNNDNDDDDAARLLVAEQGALREGFWAGEPPSISRQTISHLSLSKHMCIYIYTYTCIL